MNRLWRGLNSQLQYQIVAPFLLLTVVVMVAGALVVFYMLGQSLEERFASQLASVTRSANDALNNQEQANLQFLREIAFALPNPALDTPGVPEALASGDSDGLARSLTPFFEVGAEYRNGVLLDRLLAFDTSGRTVADFERIDGETVNHGSLDLSGAWFTERVLAGQVDEYGDKYAGLIRFEDTDRLYFATVAPVRRGDDVVGGVIAAIQIDSLLSTMASRSQAAGITLYDRSGSVISSTFGEDTAPQMSLELLNEYEASPDPAEEAVFSKVLIAGEEYQFAYVPLTIRGSTVGILAPALSRAVVTETTNSTVGPIMLLIVALSIVIIGGGVAIARFITKPIEELAQIAQEISSGGRMRSANISSNNEIGQLAASFNHMTRYLTELYGKVQAEAYQRAAIVESIADGIVVLDEVGRVQTINFATRRLMGITIDDPMPAKLSDIPLVKLFEGVPGFGIQRAHDLYTLGDYVVKVSISPVIDHLGNRGGGYVCVLQDMTAEVAVDRAKTQFIGTISHELKTPIQVIRGNADLLLRGLAGPLENEQRDFIDAIRQHVNNMTGIVNNVVVIANLDSGSLTTELEEVDLARPIGEALFTLKGVIKSKGLVLNVTIPDDLRPVLADFDQVRQITAQLLDNAHRYTKEGSISVRALDCGSHVRVEVQDTGRGIPPDMQEMIFDRFTRGDGTSEGINSAERGIGLGLAICKQLIERQGGTIGVTSVPGQGSTFFFTLRYADGTPRPEKKTPLAAAA
jgi:signal transduction histidine kinase/HAMP domain-containing protein